MQSFRVLLPALLLLSAALPAAAADSATVLDLSASAQREIANDQVDATLYVQERQARPAVLADHLNRTISRALADTRAYPQVVAKSGSYSTWPEYGKDGEIQGWQGRAEIQLRSTDFVETAQLVARLQKDMLLQRLDFSVADATRKKIEQQMLPDAIAQLQATAMVAARALGKSRVSVKELTVGNGGNAVPRPMMALMAKREAAAPDNVTTPDWQAGQSLLQMQVNGKLLLY